MYRLDVLVQGFPGKAVCHGGLGWSTITLLRAPGRVILIDVGAFGIRKPLQKQLKMHGVVPEDVTDVILTHAHYDHAINFVLFPKATVWIGDRELDWASRQPAGFNPLPELYVRELKADPRVRTIRAGEEFLPGLKAFAAPGHTPGSLIFYLTATPEPVVFTGDAAKNRAELLSRCVDASEDDEASRASIETIWQLWRAIPDTLLVPGHDLCMKLDGNGVPKYVGERRAGISAWFAETLEQTTDFNLDERAR